MRLLGKIEFLSTLLNRSIAILFYLLVKVLFSFVSGQFEKSVGCWLDSESDLDCFWFSFWLPLLCQIDIRASNRV